MFDVVSNAIAKHKLAFSFFADFCVGCFMIAVSFLVMLCMNIISFGLGIVIFVLSLCIGLLILKLYTGRISENMRKEAAITFILHGFYINIKVLMFISLVLIPLLIIMSNQKFYRYELMLIDGVWVNVRSEM